MWLLDWTAMEAIYKALVLLVTACPCALVISTPVTIVSGLAAVARRGILIKGGIYLEGARKLKAIALDKTGTITEGKPKLVGWEAVAPGADPAQVERVASALAGRSAHPVSLAIARGLPPRSCKSITSRRCLGGQCSPVLEAMLKGHEEAGRTVTLLASPAGVVGLFAVADTIWASPR